MAENNEQVQPAGSSKGRRSQRRAPRKNSTVVSVQTCGPVYVVRVSRRLVKFGLLPVFSALLGLGTRNWDLMPESEPVQATAAARQARPEPPVVRAEPAGETEDASPVFTERPAFAPLDDDRPAPPQAPPATSGLSAAAMEGKENARREKEERIAAAR